MARSATAMLAFIIIYFILNVINFKKFDKVMLLNVGILLSLLILFNLGTKNELINKNFNQRVERTVQRIFNIRNDESVNIRTQVLYKSFNSELETRSVEKSVLGNGSYINFENILPYDSSYYAIIMSGGILLVIVILVIVIKNILLYKNKIYFSILIANVVFFFSANVFFELQNIISIVFLICPGILFIPNKHGDK